MQETCSLEKSGLEPCASVNAYWFNTYSAFFGCDDDGPTDCIMQISGYQYDASTDKEVLEAQENATIPTWHGFKNCHLTLVTFLSHFRNLSGIQFDAFINGTGPQVFMMDSWRWVGSTARAQQAFCASETASSAGKRYLWRRCANSTVLDWGAP